MRSTAVRLSFMVPEGVELKWPALCSACGAKPVRGRIASVRNAPPLPYCASCLRVHRGWDRWVRRWLGLALVMVLGPVLYLGTTLDRPHPVYNSFHNLSLFYMDLAFFLTFFSAIAAGIGYVRRSELQGVHTHDIPVHSPDDPASPLASQQALLEIRFKNCDFYSATLEANRLTSGG